MLEKTLQKEIKIHQVIETGDRIVVGVSGGIDSTALLILLNSLKKEMELKIYIAHMNHRIRGRESNADEGYVKKLSKELHLPFFHESIDVVNFARTRRMNLEDAARLLRYEFFEQIRVKTGANKIAVAHTADDNIETFLMRLIRGSGLKGLESIPAVRGSIVRPMLNVYRIQLEDYLISKHIKAREDSSNFDETYLRNSVRHKLLPQLAKYNPKIKEAISRTINSMIIDNSFIEEASRRSYNRLKKKSGISIKDLQGLPLALISGVVRHYICNIKGDLNDISYVHIMNIMDILNNKHAKLDLPGVYIEINKGMLVISLSKPANNEAKDFLYKLEVPGQLRLKEAGYMITSAVLTIDDVAELKKKDAYSAYMDIKKLKSPIIVRNKKDGDVYTPFGLKGKKKLQDIFIDEKISLEDRGAIPVIADGKGILWVVGYRVSDKVKVDNRTQKVLKLTARKI